MKKILLITLCAIAFVTIAATTYTITQLTENATPGAGTIIELYDPTASPKSGKITLDSDGFRAAIGLALGTDVQPYDVDLSSLAAGKTGIVLGYGNGLFYDAVTPIAPGVLICPTGINTYEFTTDLTLGTLVVTNTASVSNITVTAAITLSDGAGGEGEVIKKVGGALTWAADETAAGGESSGTVHAPDGATTANRIAVFKDTSGTNITQAAVTVADITNGSNMTNTGTSVVGMFPVYTDTSGTQVTPTNALDSVTVSTLILTSLTETNKLVGLGTDTNAIVGTFNMWTNTAGIFSGDDTKVVSGAGTLVDKVSGAAMSGTVSNAVASAGLLSVDATLTNGIAATPAHVVSALGYTPAGTNTTIGAIGCTADGGGSAVTAGVKSYIVVPYSGHITGYSIVSDGSSPTCTWDVWKVASGTALPDNGNTITGGAEPALSSGNAVRSIAVSAWSTNFTAGDIFGFNVDAAATGTRITLTLETLR